MIRRIYMYALLWTSLLAAPSVASAQQTAASGADTSTEILTIDTPLLKLLNKSSTRAVLEKNVPNLVRAMEDDFDVSQMLGDSSLKELSIDDEHVKNFDEELLEKLRVELAQAQQS